MASRSSYFTSKDKIDLLICKIIFFNKGAGIAVFSTTGTSSVIICLQWDYFGLLHQSCIFSCRNIRTLFSDLLAFLVRIWMQVVLDRWLFEVTMDLLRTIYNLVLKFWQLPLPVKWSHFEHLATNPRLQLFAVSHEHVTMITWLVFSGSQQKTPIS